MEIHCEYVWILSTLSAQAQCLQCVAPVLVCCSLARRFGVVCIWGFMEKQPIWRCISHEKWVIFHWHVTFQGEYPSKNNGPCRVPPMSPATSFWKGGIRTSKPVENRVDLSWVTHTQNENPKNCSIMKMDQQFYLVFYSLSFLMITVSGNPKKRWTLCPRSYLKNFTLGLIPKTNDMLISWIYHPTRRCNPRQNAGLGLEFPFT